MIVRTRVLLAIGLGLVMAACSGTGDADNATTQPAGATTAAPSGSSGDEASITIDNFAFSAPSTVAVGTTVTVTNEDSFGHTWTAEGGVWDSGTLSEGDSFEFTFDEPGEYAYFCKIHPAQMTGTITVES